MNDGRSSGLWIDPIQRPVYREFGEHDDLLDRQCGAALQAAEFAGEVAGHGTGAGQRFVGVGQQGFGVDAGVDQEHLAGLMRLSGLRGEVEIDSALDGFAVFRQVFNPNGVNGWWCGFVGWIGY